ncbi:MAG: alpha-ketoglutarate-dependent dioxygenase AlkB [Pseudomonadota bacterium]
MGIQSSLFEVESQGQELLGGACTYHRDYLSTGAVDDLFTYLLHSVDWRQERLTIYGKQHLSPRLTCWMADPECVYSYSKMTMQPVAWDTRVKQLCDQVSAACQTPFNSVLINYYRDGKDSNGWHADDEPELGRNPVIGSLSLGGPRDFLLRHKNDSTRKAKLALESGSLLIMHAGMQRNWQHHIPKRANSEPRINLTFRHIQINT